MKLIPILLNEFTEKTISRLIQKFKAEGGPDENLIRSYITSFEKLQNSPNIQQKDPFQYSWTEFEEVVLDNHKSKIKAGKLVPQAQDANLVYNKKGIRVYEGKDKKACIKYADGYNFCISSRGTDNTYDQYRTATFTSHNSMDGVFGTFYFVFNDNLSSERKASSFVDPDHLLVVFVEVDWDDSVQDVQSSIEANSISQDQLQAYIKKLKLPLRYTVTDANNDPETEKPFEMFDQMAEEYPWVRPLKGILKPSLVNSLEVSTFLVNLKYQEEYVLLGRTVEKAIAKKYGRDTARDVAVVLFEGSLPLPKDTKRTVADLVEFIKLFESEQLIVLQPIVKRGDSESASISLFRDSIPLVRYKIFNKQNRKSIENYRTEIKKSLETDKLEPPIFRDSKGSALPLPQTYEVFFKDATEYVRFYEILKDKDIGYVESLRSLIPLTRDNLKTKKKLGIL